MDSSGINTFRDRQWFTRGDNRAHFLHARSRGVESLIAHHYDHEVNVPNSAVDDRFVNNLSSLVQRIGSSNPARKVPSVMECKFCNIIGADCPERAAAEEKVEGETIDC